MIPIQTTTVTVKGRRPQAAIDPDAEGYDSPPTEPTTLITGLRATITLPSARRSAGEADEVDVYTLRTDPFDLNRYDTIIDESDGTEYEVSRAIPSKPVTWGLQHTVAYIYKTQGLNSGSTNAIARD
jgi:hypothetical protein